MNNPNDTDLQIRADIELGQDLAYLETLPQFQRVIIDSYIMKILVSNSKDMIDMNPAVRQTVMEEIMSVNYFRNHLINIKDNAEKALEDKGEV